ncbi:MAG TPA: hypothetical protein VLS96_03325 [Nodosilinea sp.]|nr:hypothetical protein [Nodosilinea sp.]
MQTHAPIDFKWHRLAWALLVTVIVADTAPHPGLSPGLLQSLATQVQTRLSR